MGALSQSRGICNKINLNLPARCTGEDLLMLALSRYHFFIIEVVCMHNMKILTVRVYFECQKWFHAKLEQCADSAK